LAIFDSLGSKYPVHNKAGATIRYVQSV
jgi:hypothetical protein